MDPAQLELGTRLAAVALIFWAFISFFMGTASATGQSFRSSLQPLLSSVRSSSSMSRQQLADASMVSAAVFAGMAVIVDRSIVAVLVAGLLWKARPQLRRLTSEENPLRAIAGSFSLDLVIGIYLPILLSQVIVGNYFIALTLMLVVVSLSWPAGGGATRPGAWRPAWQG